MSARLPIRPLVRQLQASLAQSKAAISSTSKNAGLQDLGRSSAASTLTNFDDSATTPGAASSAGNASLTAHGSNAGGPDGGAADIAKVLRDRDAYKGISRNEVDLLAKSKEITARNELAGQMTRKWNDGDVYAPHDLSEVEMMKWKQPKRPTKDIIDILGLNPLDHYKNFAMVSEFMTEMGRIKHSNETGLRPVNQRKMAKAIRRAIGMGIHPSTHRHPEILFGQIRVGPRYQNPSKPPPQMDKIQVK